MAIKQGIKSYMIEIPVEKYKKLKIASVTANQTINNYIISILDKELFGKMK